MSTVWIEELSCGFELNWIWLGFFIYLQLIYTRYSHNLKFQIKIFWCFILQFNFSTRLMLWSTISSPKSRLFSESVMQFSHCPKNVPKTILNKRFWNCVMFYVNKKRKKIQNTKLRIEGGTLFGQWKKYVNFSENIISISWSSIVMIWNAIYFQNNVNPMCVVSINRMSTFLLPRYKAVPSVAHSQLFNRNVKLKIASTEKIVSIHRAVSREIQPSCTV